VVFFLGGFCVIGVFIFNLSLGVGENGRLLFGWIPYFFILKRNLLSRALSAAVYWWKIVDSVGHSS
jgi:hypothetical protein